MIAWFRALGARDRRAIAMGAAVVAAGLIGKFVLAPAVRAIAGATTRLETERALFAREAALLALVPGSSEHVERLGEHLLTEARHLFDGQNPRHTTSVLTEYVQTVARGSHVLLARVEPGPYRAVGAGLSSLPLQVRGEGDLEGLITLLYSLETGAKRVRVDQLHIRGPRAGAFGAPDPRETLQFDFIATGYMLADARAATAPSRVVSRTDR